MEVKVRELDYFVGWLVFWVSASVCGAVVGGIAGGVVGGILGAAGVSVQMIQIVGFFVGILVSLPFSYLLFRLIVSKLIVRKVQPLETS